MSRTAAKRRAAHRNAVRVLDKHLNGSTLVRRHFLAILVLGVDLVEVHQQHDLVLHGLVKVMLQRARDKAHGR